MIVAVTGHRPDKLGGYRTPNPTYNSVMEGLDRALLELQPDQVLIGMAQGVDQWMAELCIWNGIPFTACIPCDGFERMWPAFAQVKFHQLLSRAAEVHVISPGDYAPWKMQRRNEFMVDNADHLIAVFNGTSGGTANCLAYAQANGKRIHFVPFTAPTAPPPIVARPQLDIRAEPAPEPASANRRSIFNRPARQPQEESEGQRAARRRARQEMEAEERRLAAERRVREDITARVEPPSEREIEQLRDLITTELGEAVATQLVGVAPEPSLRQEEKKDEGPVVRDFSRVVDIDLS